MAYLFPMHRPVLSILLLALSQFAPLSRAAEAEKTPPAKTSAAADEAPPEVSSKEQKTEELFQEFTSAAQFDEAVKAAKAAGVGAQAILEARFSYASNTQNQDAQIALLPELEKSLTEFKPDSSPNFRTKNDLEAIIFYLRGLDKLKNGDEEGFKKEILEAIWISPDQNEIFLAAIKRHQWQKRWAETTIDPAKMKLRTLQGKDVSLASLMEGKKGVLLDLWASWANPCMADLSALKFRSERLAKHGIALVAVNLDEADAVQIAKAKQAELALEPIPWLLENEEKTLSLKFEVETVPHYILLGPDGKVLYNESPQKTGLTRALRKLAPEAEEWE